MYLADVSPPPMPVRDVRRSWAGGQWLLVARARHSIDGPRQDHDACRHAENSSDGTLRRDSTD